MTRAVGYVRVSTAQQADGGVSLEAQRAQLVAYAALYGVELVAVETDTGSGKSLQRPGLTRALARLEEGTADALLVAKLDRLTRSVRDLSVLCERYFSEGRFELLAVQEQLDTRSSAGRLVLNVLASVSQWERERVGERTREALQFKSSRGERVGSVPYGRQLAADGVHLLPEPKELRTLARIHELRDSGLSLRAVVATIAEEGHRTRRGGAFSLTWVRELLKRREGASEQLSRVPGNVPGGSRRGVPADVRRRARGPRLRARAG